MKGVCVQVDEISGLVSCGVFSLNFNVVEAKTLLSLCFMQIGLEILLYL